MISFAVVCNCVHTNDQLADENNIASEWAAGGGQYALQSHEKHNERGTKPSR